QQRLAGQFFGLALLRNAAIAFASRLPPGFLLRSPVLLLTLLFRGEDLFQQLVGILFRLSRGLTHRVCRCFKGLVCDVLRFAHVVIGHATSAVVTHKSNASLRGHSTFKTQRTHKCLVIRRIREPRGSQRTYYWAARHLSCLSRSTIPTDEGTLIAQI